MRKDLNKQLCERERIGSRRKYAEVRHKRRFIGSRIDEDTDLPLQEGMKKRYGWNTKNLNENLNPLYGFLRKAVGRRWDDVYSEICAVFDKRSVVNNHILEHLYDKVIRDVTVGEDGCFYSIPKYGYEARIAVNDPNATSYFYAEYYVHPITGILTRIENRLTFRQRANKKRQEDLQKLLQDHVYDAEGNRAFHRVNGIWFTYDMIDVPKGHFVYRPADKDPEKTYDVYGKQLTWEMVPVWLRSKFGVRTFEGQEAFDEFLQYRIFFNTSTNRLDSSHGLGIRAHNVKTEKILSCMPKKFKKCYHANRRTSSKKEIRRIEELSRRSKTDITTLS